MKYYKLFKAFSFVEMQKANTDVKTSTPVIEPVVEEKVVAPVIDNSISEEVLGLLRDIKSNIDNHSTDESDSTSLSDDEVNELLESTLEMQAKYFNDVPMSEEQNPGFIWNIPREVYEAFVTYKTRNLPDCMNPMFWFYMFMIADFGFAFPYYISKAVSVSSDAEWEVLSQKAEQYEMQYESEHEGTLIPES